MNLNSTLECYKKFGHLVEANGYKIVPVKNKLMAEYKYKWNAVKFSFKVFSIYLASKLEEILIKLLGLMRYYLYR